ncbi:MAG TPA: ABC transporter ATP-binding protein [Anaerolineae bacterium]|nr:ABC transporter ATP-binding protein [Anaerolineae bacterium]
MDEAIVAVKGVNKVFEGRGGQRTVALQDINLRIAPGEFVSIIGPSGCGKSTLLRVVGDLVEPTEGEVMVAGKSARAARLAQAYGIAFQAPVLYEWRTILKNIQLPMELRGFSKEEKESRAREMLALVELADFGGHYPWQLSGGMQQRAAIARALAMRPSLLLMDEPFGALDEMTRERMNLALQAIWQKTETTVIFITHSIAEAVFLSTRVVVMSARPGQIMEEIGIDLPLPRDERTHQLPRFFELLNEVRSSLRRAEGVHDGA